MLGEVAHLAGLHSLRKPTLATREFSRWGVYPKLAHPPVADDTSAKW